MLIKMVTGLKREMVIVGLPFSSYIIIFLSSLLSLWLLVGLERGHKKRWWSSFVIERTENKLETTLKHFI